MTDRMTTVQGRCPACGWTSLFLGDGGHVTCSRLDCPNPCAADDLLHGGPHPAEARLAHQQTTSEAAGRLLTRTTDERDQLRDAVDRVRAVVHVADDEDVTDWQRGFRACSVVALGALDQPAPDGHVYLPTGCLHGDHAYCQSMTGLNGQKRPGECKHCAAPCQCFCHREPS